MFDLCVVGVGLIGFVVVKYVLWFLFVCLVGLDELMGKVSF